MNRIAGEAEMTRLIVTPEKAETIIGMYKEDFSAAEIAPVVGLSKNTVHSWIKDNRYKYELPRQRKKTAINPTSRLAEETTAWNTKLGFDFISRRWA